MDDALHRGTARHHDLSGIAIVAAIAAIVAVFVGGPLLLLALDQLALGPTVALQLGLAVLVAGFVRALPARD